MAWHKCSGTNDFEKLINTAPIGVLNLSGSAGASSVVAWEHNVQLGAGHKKVKAICTYYGPGAVAGSALNGVVNCSINDTPIQLTKISTVRNEPLAKAVEYWECDISPDLNVQTFDYSASDYAYNNDSRAAISIWVI